MWLSQHQNLPALCLGGSPCLQVPLREGTSAVATGTDTLVIQFLWSPRQVWLHSLVYLLNKYLLVSRQP